MQQGKAATPLVLYVFDVLEVEGEPLLDLPFTERRERLAALLDPAAAPSASREAFEDGEALFAAAEGAAARGDRLEAGRFPRTRPAGAAGPGSR